VVLERLLQVCPLVGVVVSLVLLFLFPETTKLFIHCVANCTKPNSMCSRGWCEVTSNCTPCPAGSYNSVTNATQCLPCPRGYYQPHEGQSNCSVCVPGSYQNNTGQPYCLSCGFGYYNPNWGSTSRNACLVCDPGYFCPSLQTKLPIDCPPGYFCPNYALREPIPCPAGFYCAKSCTVQPIVCPAGSYCPIGTSNPLTCSFLFTSREQQSSCYPTVAFYLIIILAGLVATIFLGWIARRLLQRIRAKKRNQHYQSQSQSQSQFSTQSFTQHHTETSRLIPEPIDGPCYSGL
jgi:hypothetical protein